MANREVWVLEENRNGKLVLSRAYTKEGWAIREQTGRDENGAHCRVVRYVPEDELEVLKRQLAESQDLAARLQQDLTSAWALVNPTPAVKR